MYFIGLDPATDLRGCGFLGLLTTLYLVTDQRTHALALDIYKLSQHETQNFPFSIMSINITRIALQTLREEKLNKYVPPASGQAFLYAVNCVIYVELHALLGFG